MTKKKILCTIISVLLLGTSICSVFAADTTANLGTATEPAAVGYMERISAPANFDFEIISTGRDSMVAEFTAAGRITNPPYVGEKGTKIAAEKVSSLQYVLEYDKEYSFVYTVTENDIETVYNSFLTVEREDGIKVVFDDIIKNEISDESTRAVGTIYESEPNNTLATADQTHNDYDNIGVLTSTSDEDWWKVMFTQAGRANFWLGNIPAGCDYDLTLYDAAKTQLAYSWNLENEQELIQYEVTPNTYYYIRVDTYEGYSNDSYLFRTKNYPEATLSVPLYRQEKDNTCSCASGRMLLASHGIYVSEENFETEAKDIAAQYSADFKATWIVTFTLNHFLSQYNNTVRYAWTNVNSYSLADYQDFILTKILNGHPVQVLIRITDQDYFPYTTDGHYVVIKGMVNNPSGSGYNSVVNDPHNIYSDTYTVPISKIMEYNKAHPNPAYIIHVDD